VQFETLLKDIQLARSFCSRSAVRKPAAFSKVFGSSEEAWRATALLLVCHHLSPETQVPGRQFTAAPKDAGTKISTKQSEKNMKVKFEVSSKRGLL